MNKECFKLFVEMKECPDTCEYKHGPYCNRKIDDPDPKFDKVNLNKGSIAQ